MITVERPTVLKPKSRANIPIQSTRMWDGAIIHGSLNRDGLIFDWDGVNQYHASYRVDGKAVSVEEFRKWKIQRNTLKFEEPMTSVGYHAAVEYTDQDGEFKPTVHMGRSLELTGVHTPSINNSMNTKYLGILIIGNFDTLEPPKELWSEAIHLVRSFMEFFKFTRPFVIGHSEADEVSQHKIHQCLGGLWDMDKFRKAL